MQPFIAWQPLTPRGVAAFAVAPWRRLLLVQFIVALLVAAGVAWFGYDRYVPVIANAIFKLPAEGQIRNQQLDWRGASPVMLEENSFLALSVSLEQRGQVRSVADVQVEFSRSQVTIYSLFGYVELPYPSGWIIPVNQEQLQPLWGAWLPAALALVLLGVVLGLFLTWFALAALYALPVWWLGFFLDRGLRWRGSWKLSGAALLPGALLMLLAISCYDLGVMNLVGLLSVCGAHFLVGWVYLILGLLAAPRVAAGAARNPFATARKK